MTGLTLLDRYTHLASRIFSTAAFLALIGSSATHAQPVLQKKIAPQIVGLPGRTLDLSEFINVVNPSVSPEVQVVTPLGFYNMQLLPDAAPLTVANFFSYIDDGSYDNLIVHRTESGFVTQTGAFKANIPPTPITTQAPVANEYHISNTRGTVAMARLSGKTNSATSQWFVNLNDNSFLNNVDGGFTVFARVLGDGMVVVDALAAVPTYDLRPRDTNTNVITTSPYAALGQLPLRDLQTGQSAPKLENLLPINGVYRLPFHATSSSPSAWSVAVDGNNLALRPGRDASRPATVTVRAADEQGRTVKTSFVVKSAPARGYTGVGPSPFGIVRFTLDVLASGAFSGTVISVSGTSRFKGSIDLSGSESQEITFAGGEKVSILYQPSTDIFSATYGPQSFLLRPFAWPSGETSSPLNAKLVNILLDLGASGWLQSRFDQTGTAKIKGRLADGTPVTASARCVLGESLTKPIIPLAVFWTTGPSASLTGSLQVDAQDIISPGDPILSGSLTLTTNTGATQSISATGSLWSPPGIKILSGSEQDTTFNMQFSFGSTKFDSLWPASDKPTFLKGQVTTFKYTQATGLISGKVLTGSTLAHFSGLLTGHQPGMSELVRGGGFMPAYDGRPAGSWTINLHY